MKFSTKNCKLITILCTACTIGLAFLFPPIVKTWRGVIVSSGYGFIFDLPNDRLCSTVNVPTMLVEILVILIIGGLIYFFFHNKNSGNNIDDECVKKKKTDIISPIKNKVAKNEIRTMESSLMLSNLNVKKNDNSAKIKTVNQQPNRTTTRIKQKIFVTLIALFMLSFILSAILTPHAEYSSFANFIGFVTGSALAFYSVVLISCLFLSPFYWLGKKDMAGFHWVMCVIFIFISCALAITRLHNHLKL